MILMTQKQKVTSGTLLSMERVRDDMAPVSAGLSQLADSQRIVQIVFRRHRATLVRAARSGRGGEGQAVRRRSVVSASVAGMRRAARWRWFLGVSAVGLVAGAGLLAPGARASGLEGVPAFGHVFVIVGENQGLNRLTPARSPYLTGTVKPRSAFLTRYTGATWRFAGELPGDGRRTLHAVRSER